MKARLVIYVRADCHLCEDMVGQLRELQAAYSFEIEHRDVDLRPAWRQTYGDKVPVLLCGEVEICRYLKSCHNRRSSNSIPVRQIPFV